MVTRKISVAGQATPSSYGTVPAEKVDVEGGVEGSERIERRHQTMRHDDDLESHSTPWWWDDNVPLPAWYRKTRRRMSPYLRFSPAYGTMFAIALHSSGYFLMYGSETDPLAPLFILYHVFLAICFVCVLTMSCIDPGVVPPRMDLVMRRGGSKAFHDSFLQKSTVSSELLSHDPEDSVIDTPFSPSVETLYQEIRGVRHKWCYTCKIWRPPKTVHCGDCGFCIAGYDHHCGVMGQCIGKRNIRFFAALFGSAAAAGAVIFAAAVVRAIEITDNDDPWKDWTWYMTLLGCLYGFGSFFGFSSPFIGYTEMSCSGETIDSIVVEGHVDFRGRWKKYSWKHVYEFWFAPLGQSFKRYGHPFAVNRGYYSWQ